MKSMLLLICIIATLGLEIEGSTVNQSQLILSSVCSGKDAVLVPMSGSCSGFFFCVEGIATASSCGPFYRFNPLMGICDHPWNVPCKESAPGVAEVKQVANDTEAMHICSMPTFEGHMVGRARSCNQFYECRNHTMVRRICPPQRHFNVDTQSCQNVGQATCEFDGMAEDNSETVDQPNVAEPEEEVIENPLEKPFVWQELPLMSLCANARANELISYPSDCTKFIYCYRERPMVLTCPNGLHYSRSARRCVEPADAQCQLK